MTSLIVREDLRNITNSDLPWDNFEDKTILVSGANGFLPAYMVKSLMYLNNANKKNIKVVCLVRDLERAKYKFSDFLRCGTLKIKLQDICRPLDIRGGVDYIVHAASQASPKYYGKDPVGTLCANTIGTYNLLNLAREKEIEAFLFFSSAEVYGQVDPSQIPIKETSYGPINPLDVRSCYAESKKMGETMCIAWSHQYDIPVKIVRPFHTYGPGMNLDDGRVYADFIADLIRSRDIVMRSDGSSTRAFCYLSDAVLGFFAVMLKGETRQAYNIGNDKCEISILDFARMIIKLSSRNDIKIIRQDFIDEMQYIQSKVSRSCPDISKVRMLGWEPKYGLEEGLRRTIQWFLEENTRNTR